MNKNPKKKINIKPLALAYYPYPKLKFDIIIKGKPKLKPN